MISICIPVFNYDVTDLIHSLLKLIADSDKPYEIVLIDDGSTDSIIKNKNRSLRHHLQYIELDQNIGRNAIRFYLAQQASFPFLLFLDADSVILNSQFLKKYEMELSKDNVVSGGRVYDKNLKPSSDKLLHYKYGIKREEALLKVHSKTHSFFLSCNFLISKTVFQRLKFVDLKDYGHEDSFMYLQFLNLNIPVKNIDNPVVHKQLVDKRIFVNNQENALKNLIYLYEGYKFDFDFDKIKVIKVYHQFRHSGLGIIVLKSLALGKPLLRKLSLAFNSLFFLDLWKLSTVAVLASTNNKQRGTFTK